MATIRGIFETGLAASVAQKAIKNTLEEEWLDKEYGDEIDLAVAIASSFPWDQTPEGFEFWNDIHNEAMYNAKQQ